jgi:dTDP-4-amino-4,6-dideoxygalactose transaminase
MTLRVPALPTAPTKARQVPFHIPDVQPSDRQAVDAVLRSGWLTSGPRVAEFESRFAVAVGAGNAVALSSCTAALQIALSCWEIGPGDEVILPTLTFASAAEVVLHAGATPVLADVRRDDLTIDVGHARHLISPRTRVIMPMHYGGQPYDVVGVRDLARARGLLVLDDAAHALPTRTTLGRVGCVADITCFSFYANKTLTTGEGGMLVTENPEWARTCRSLSLHGLTDDAWSRFRRGGSWNYDVVRLGFKSNLTDVAAAMGLSQLNRLELNHRRRRAAVAYYQDRLADVPGVVPVAQPIDGSSSYHLFVVRLDGSRYDRDDVSRWLGERGIGTSVHYKPLHRHPLIQRCVHVEPDAYPEADRAYGEILSLPLFPAMTRADIDLVCDSLEAARLAGAS